ncbi:MAG: T9SS type A sorting domain-containing protein [candidate division KSB1 bacterium]|nr:T9SS type A sorting domain-containing protein [candidate division KSB1 bacterium]
MRNKLMLTVVVLLTVTGLVAAQDMVTVTFYANTATVPDTLRSNSIVQVRGSVAPLTWGGDSPVILENVEGDYWMGSFEFPADTTVNFKFYTNSMHDSIYAGAGWEHEGWEANIGAGDRVLETSDSDTTLPLQFVNGLENGLDQYFRPFESNDSTFVVWIRVNMQGWEDFNPENHVVGIRGSNNDDWGQTGELGWGTTYPLEVEANHANGGSIQYNGANFYSAPVHVPNQYADNGIEFKVVVHNAGNPLDEDWGNLVAEEANNRPITFTGSGNDTTNHWFWFMDMQPIPTDHEDQVIVEFRADMSEALTTKGFSLGDTLEVRAGYAGSANETVTKQMQRQGFSNVYAAVETLTTTIGKDLYYQFYKVEDNTDYREIFYNFYYEGDDVNLAERRAVVVSGEEMTVEDIEESNVSMRRMPVFRNTDVLAQDVMVTYTCDLRPAFYTVLSGKVLNDIQGNLDISDPDSVMAKGVAMNGPATGSWSNDVGADWGPHLMTLDNKRMWDDGTHGDAVAGDSIYTIQFQYFKDSSDVVGQEFKFGVGGGDNEGGEGGYGNNHVENIDDTQSEFTIDAQFGSINPAFYDAWDFDAREPLISGVEEKGQTPLQFALMNNYPNPFNPVTTIEYSLSNTEKVELSVYNVIGEKVAELVNQEQSAGEYSIQWDGTDQMGNKVSTGVYIYQIRAGSFTSTQKMVLVK